MGPAPDSTGIYVHIPFCRVRCAYCPFAITTSLALHDQYFSALHRELEMRLPPGKAVDSIYLGGGTPSRASASAISSLLEAIRSRGAVRPDAEVTLEANPEDVSEESLRMWREAGVNRISIGVQSLSDEELRQTGRKHDAAAAIEALQRVVSTGLRTNADLIVGLPGQSAESFEASLRQVLQTGTEHLSCYLLDLEEGTALASRVRQQVVTLPDEELYERGYRLLVQICAEVGLRQYEVSNFARPGAESRHNLRYWNRRPYLGLGMSAHSFMGRERFANETEIRRYIAGIEAGSAESFHETLDSDAERRERLLLGLRRTEGLPESEFLQLASAAAEGWIERGRREGWLRRDRVAFTTHGFLMSNELIAELF